MVVNDLDSPASLKMRVMPLSCASSVWIEDLPLIQVPLEEARAVELVPSPQNTNLEGEVILRVSPLVSASAWKYPPLEKLSPPERHPPPCSLA
jgi:hypothetical protein